MARTALVQMPPESRFREADARLIARYRDPLLALEGEVVKRFYDSLYAHPATSAVFVDGERPAREKTLIVWWRRTLEGPLDDHVALYDRELQRRLAKLHEPLPGVEAVLSELKRRHIPHAVASSSWPVSHRRATCRNHRWPVSTLMSIVAMWCCT